MSRFRQGSGTRPWSSKALAQSPFNRRKRSARPSLNDGAIRPLWVWSPDDRKHSDPPRDAHLFAEHASRGWSWFIVRDVSQRLSSAIDDSGVLGKRGVGAHRVETSFRYRNPRLCVSRPVGHRSVPLQKRGSPRAALWLATTNRESDWTSRHRVSTRTSAEEPKVSEACPHIGEVRARVVNAIRARKNFAYCRSRFTTSNVLNPPFSDG
jgi:hypothetical protein